MAFGKSALSAAGRYLQTHPEELRRIARNALGLRFGVPVDAFRWLLSQLAPPEIAKSVSLHSQPPGLAVTGEFSLEGADFAGSLALFVEGVNVSEHEIRVDLRLEDVDLRVLGGRKTALSALLKAGALDLSRPGDLLRELPEAPPGVRECHGNRVSLDLLAIPAVAADPRLAQLVGLVSSWLTIDGVKTTEEHLDLQFRPLPRGLGTALAQLNEHVVRPSVARAQAMLPSPMRARVQEQVRKVSALLGSSRSDY